MHYNFITASRQTGHLADGRVLKGGSVTFEWFVRNRYRPLREGDWRPETAKEKTAQIEIDLVKDPTRKLRIPKNLRPKDRQVLTWDQLRSILAMATRMDRLLLMLDMTDALRPSELLALRWMSFDNANTLSLTETVYRRKLRPFGKTVKSLGNVHLPDGLADEFRQWKLECPDSSPEAFIFANAGGLLDPRNYRNRVLKPLAEALALPNLTFQMLRRTMVTRAQNLGSVKDIQAHLRHSRADTTASEYMQELPESVQQMVGTVYAMLTSTATPQRIM